MYARVSSAAYALRGIPFGIRALVMLLGVVLLLTGTGWAQNDVNQPAAKPAVTIGQVKPPETPESPYVAEVTGNDVFIRSGPNANTYYQCGKLYKGDKVQVVKAEQDWVCIVPPPGCFSWIPMQYVSINLNNPTMGIITGDNVRIYAGSDYVEPMHSTSEQVRLFRGDNVRLLGEEKDDYYKIAPPQGAYLWVSSQFLRRMQPAGDRGVVQTEPTQGPAGQTPQVQTQPATESELLDAYYALSKLVKAEHDKPMAGQNYAAVKEKLLAIAQNQAAGKAARYADFTLKQVERFELAGTVSKEIELQSKQLSKVTEKIDEARQARLAEIKDFGKFAVIGKLENSSLYGTSDQTKRYRILDDSGKTVCYVAPVGAAAGQDLSKLIGKKVGLVGQIEPHEATARAFIKFTEIVPLETAGAQAP